MNRLQQIIRAIIVSWVLFAIGVFGYMLIEKWSFLDAVYMTAITVTTAGFMEVHELSATGRIFTSIILVAGVGYFFYIAGLFVQAIVEGEIKSILGRKRLDKKIRKLKNHYIVCG